ncbi:hypothetical protein A3C17_04010 [Candidatus Uhrbacteria bacterium RIFCSPHIGHO2_02_FULL_53_13]|uniref:Uncharacterized protein n=2 Tax=Candidatus Uhriibacteriota TaxID=1752732 RepID=A0A1F7TWY2_9BACT|nr:MAG: hypothetical protein A3C17_04010 [Candidatus Uhrbacteria bacterium RIFCSPHIGHO2_02_FULL_53_13]OGL89566.1 MAG: hypothetical protein A3I45_04795 [Candidatus Uhrbacteria bacterium RIFCSPLOWO2_02_FULL_53_10]
MTHIKKITCTISAIAYAIAAPTSLFAAALYNPLGEVSVPLLIGRVIQAVLGISGSIALLMFVWGGFLWLTSAGKPERIKSGQDTLLWSVIGIAVIFGAYAIVNFLITSASGVTTSGA